MCGENCKHGFEWEGEDGNIFSRPYPDAAMSSGAAKVRQIYEKQNLTVVELASGHNLNVARERQRLG
ncbi:hypothetical protein [Microcoleus sp. OTE_8_concoct_300]|uniref:hypothetical protein n=1 Tax=Microcoleus sp. OTE_8_concoct_300 TaxID=2964710 RepID=UPI00403F526C